MSKSKEVKIKMGLILSNILTNKDIPLHIKCAVGTSLTDILDNDLSETEDADIVKHLNKSIDVLCEEMKETHGVEDFRKEMRETVTMAKKMSKEIMKEIKAKQKRVKEGEDILKGICLN
jgi:hypothetical protein